jgi:hypothetical protein
LFEISALDDSKNKDTIFFSLNLPLAIGAKWDIDHNRIVNKERSSASFKTYRIEKYLNSTKLFNENLKKGSNIPRDERTLPEMELEIARMKTPRIEKLVILGFFNKLLVWKLCNAI